MKEKMKEMYETLPKRITRLLSKGSKSLKDLQENLDVDEQTLKITLTLMRDQGVLNEPSPGRYESL
jgi:predicted transcriptional regulator